MIAVRNIRLCTKDCLCLFVCPTGATNTDNGQIDPDRCLAACRACVDACPSGAISKVPLNYPPQQPKLPGTLQAMNQLLDSRLAQERAADAMLAQAQTAIQRQFAQAMKMSLRVVAEDVLRESGYMLPQGQPARAFLNSLLDSPPPAGFPREAVERLLALLG